MSMSWALALIAATLCLFVWLVFAHPAIAAVWFIAAFVVTLFFSAAVGIAEEGDAE